MAPPINVHKNVGAAPSNHHKFVADKVKTHFVDRYRAYQWGQGFDVRAQEPPSGQINAEQVVLKCATLPTCPFDISATLQTFTSGAVAGQRGWGVDSTPFQPLHSHPAPYGPLDLAQENVRRAPLPNDHPSLSAPPLIPVPVPKTGPTFADIIQQVNPAYLEYQPSFTQLGISAETRLNELGGIDEEDLRAMCEGEAGIPPLVSVLMCNDVLQARKTAAGLVTEDEAQAMASARARGMEWVKTKLDEGFQGV